ncbi:MAG TPA: GtrA family protein [Candidatus Sulfotelmatobacter sp.]|nr:GtrA family protein [Candidatus Sulfotelmatobacter sp.]
MSTSPLWQSVARWLKFNLVGAIGIAVQLSALWFLTWEGMRYLLATALAVEAAVLHNFVWHERYTWLDRRSRTVRDATARFLRFNFTTGTVSIVGNLLLMGLLVGEAHLPPIFANIIAIAICSVANFLVSDRWVFRTARAK